MKSRKKFISKLFCQQIISACPLTSNKKNLYMLHGAGFVISLSDKIEQEFRDADNAPRQKALQVIQEEASRVPCLAEQCIWTIRNLLGPYTNAITL